MLGLRVWGLGFGVQDLGFKVVQVLESGRKLKERVLKNAQDVNAWAIEFFCFDFGNSFW